ncbi:MAG: DUF2490 domain-containing protein [Bacteroidales bacterium]|nr:DUF2490 domain-containing protein [Bacteroidales bacterium]
MTTMTIRRYSLFLSILILFTTGELIGQRKDFSSWYEFEIDKGLNNGVDLSLEVEQRFKNNSLKYDRTQLTLAGEYDITDYFSTAVGFRALLTTNRELQLQRRYRMHVDATGSHSISGFDLSLRLRLQYGFDDQVFVGYFRDNNLVNRNRLKIEHHLFGSRLGFFATIESWHMFIGDPGRLFYKMRYSAGAQYTLNFRSEFSLRYILEDEFNVVNPLQSHILVLGYSHSL